MAGSGIPTTVISSTAVKIHMEAQLKWVILMADNPHQPAHLSQTWKRPYNFLAKMLGAF